MISEEIKQKLVSICVDKEYRKALSDQQRSREDYDSYLDLFDAIRSQKEYDWMSDIFIPEFPSHVLSMQGDDAATYFQTRDFVECYIQDPRQVAMAAAEAQKELINRTLNRENLFHFQKYIRGKTISYLAGYVWLLCWWEREEDDNGVTKDQFNYDVIDPRNVFTDNRYVYSAQQKTWVTVRDETTIDRLKEIAKQESYFGLDNIKATPHGKSETRTDTEDPDNQEEPFPNTIDMPVDRLRRFGKFWVKNGKPGIDKSGNPLEGAELKECVITTIMCGGSNYLIGFNEQTYVDPLGNPYRPLIRGLCYIHPSNDNGAGDGKYAYELQVGINDTFNLNNDRTFLATMPTFKGKRYVMQDTDTMFMKPMHMIEMENPSEDLQEIVIHDNIQGGLTQLGVLTDKMRQVTGVQPPDLGSVPELSSTTATAVAKAGQGSDRRANLKGLTFENTALTELYKFIGWMTWQFATPETGEHLMGEKVAFFNPVLSYYYKPLSQSLETEQSKNVKIQRYQGIMQNLVPMMQLHPDFLKQWNQCYERMLALMGDEYVNISKANEDVPVRQDESGTGSPTSPVGMQGGTQNQYGIAQSPDETLTRESGGM